MLHLTRRNGRNVQVLGFLCVLPKVQKNLRFFVREMDVLCNVCSEF